MPAPKRSRPLFTRLNGKTSRELLQRNHVGRLCFVSNGQPDVAPVHYVSEGAWIFIRSAPGTKMDAFAHRPYVAFEVDEVVGTFDWQSVVARGTIYLLPSDGSRLERKELDRAIRALRSFVPATFTPEDPTPTREIVYGIHVDELTGRKATPHVAASKRTIRRAIRRPTRVKRAGKGT